jgi:imidazolonepropionase-like amidohydrolase
MPKDKLPMVAKLQQDYGDFGARLMKNKVKVVFASDYVGDFADAERARRYELWWRTQAFGSNFEVLKQLTSTAGEMLAMSGPRNPYKAGKLGVIEQGAYADLILVDGNPLKDITVIGGTDKWFDADPEYRLIPTIHLVMKGGNVYRNDIDGKLSPAAVSFPRMTYKGIIQDYIP